jgi:hypothetical protein
MTLNPDQKDRYRETLSAESKKNTNLIMWENSSKLPDGISLQNGGIHIDSTKFKEKPKVNLVVNSTEKNDETFVTINTNGKMNTPGETIGLKDLSQQNLFANGLHDITDVEAVALNTTIKDIQTLINESQVSKK